VSLLQNHYTERFGPATAAVIPEPNTLLLGVLAALGLLAPIRKGRK
jgi:hypothetical protein